MRLPETATDVRWRRGLQRRGHGPRTSPSLGRRMLARTFDMALVCGVLEATYRASGLGSAFVPAGGPADPDPAATAAGAGAATGTGQPRVDQHARRRRHDFLAAELWSSVVVGADTGAGRTPGRALAGIRLERRDGRPLTLGRAVLRQAAPAVRGAVLKALWRHLPRDDRRVAALLALAVNVLELAVSAADDEKRSMGDRIAGTRLVRG